jgi:hypothetical protein
VAKAYVGNASRPGKAIGRLNDILPFRWIDLVFLVPLLGAAAFFLSSQYGEESGAFSIAATSLVLTAIVAAYGALVFPVRYYLRHRAPLHALGNYLLSSFIIYVIFGAAYLTLRFSTDIFQGEDPVQVMLSFAAMWAGFTLVAFMIYGALSGHRAIRSFRSNIRKL